MSTVIFDVKGTQALNANLKKLATDLHRKAQSALYLEGELIGTAADKIVPVDYGVLRSSRTVTLNKDDGDPSNISVTISYGGAAEAYALYQHEHLELVHKGQGQAKYLETPLKAAIPGMNDRIARRMKI